MWKNVSDKCSCEIVNDAQINSPASKQKVKRSNLWFHIFYKTPDAFFFFCSFSSCITSCKKSSKVTQVLFYVYACITFERVFRFSKIFFCQKILVPVWSCIDAIQIKKKYLVYLSVYGSMSSASHNNMFACMGVFFFFRLSTLTIVKGQPNFQKLQYIVKLRSTTSYFKNSRDMEYIFFYSESSNTILY